MEIYVGNLAYATTDDGLKAAFAQFGEVTAVRVVTDRMTGRAKSVVAASAADAAASAADAAATVIVAAMAIAALVARHAGNRWFVDSIQTGSAAHSPRFLFSGA